MPAKSVDHAAVGLFLDLEAELAFVERPRASEVLGGDVGTTSGMGSTRVEGLAEQLEVDDQDLAFEFRLFHPIVQRTHHTPLFEDAQVCTPRCRR